MLLAASTARAGPEAKDSVKSVSRLLNLGFSALILVANDPLTPDALEPLVAAGLCLPDEAAVLAKCSDPLAVIFGWACALLDDLCYAQRALSETTLQTLQGQMVELRNNAGDALLYVQARSASPFPAPHSAALRHPPNEWPPLRWPSLPALV